MRVYRRRRSCGCSMLPLIMIIGILIVLFIYNKAADGFGFFGQRKISYDVGATKEEKAEILAEQFPRAEEIVRNIDQYSEDMIDMALRNPETLRFVLDYPKNTNGTTNKPNIAKEIKDFRVPHFLQWDKRWGYDKYGSSVIGLNGCGPTCLSMVYTALTGRDDYDPKTMAEFSERNGYYINGSGTSWSLMTDGAARLGLKVNELPLSEDTIKNALNNGSFIIASVGPGDFTLSGHFIVIHDIDKGGSLHILDPNSKVRSQKRWKYAEVKPQIVNLWAFSK